MCIEHQCYRLPEGKGIYFSYTGKHRSQHGRLQRYVYHIEVKQHRSHKGMERRKQVPDESIYKIGKYIEYICSCICIIIKVLKSI